MPFSALEVRKLSACLLEVRSLEAEVYACSSGSSDAILLSRLLAWLTDRRTLIFVYTNSSGAKGFVQRKELVAYAILAAGFCGSKDWWQIEQSSCPVSSAAT
jgi:hypothetical protein